MSVVLKAEEVSVVKDGASLLAEVSLEVLDQEWLCIVGPNGAGKSTLLRCLAGLQASDGSIASSLVSNYSDRRARARAIAYVPQSPTIPSHMSVFEFALLGRRAHLSALAAESAADKDVVASTLAQLELGEFHRRRMDTLSGGERQRAVLAQALCQQTPLLLLDEPTTALDIGHREQLLDLLQAIRKERGLTVVMSMHDLQAAAQHSHRVVLMANGRVNAVGSPREVFTNALLSEAFSTNLLVQWIDGDCFLNSPRRPVASS